MDAAPIWLPPTPPLAGSASKANRLSDIFRADGESWLGGKGKCNIGNRFSHTQKFPATIQNIFASFFFVFVVEF